MYLHALHTYTYSGSGPGVGFRPTVYRLALENSLKGWVSNGLDGVHIELEGAASQIEKFLASLKMAPPIQAKITNILTQKVPERGFIDFSIHDSERVGAGDTLITPDLGLCNKCRKDIRNPSDRRYQYDFTTCTHCGPRYSIVKRLPYDRETTTMAHFKMCPACNTEYRNIQDRRYYSQTNSCPQCGIQLTLLDNQGNAISDDNNDAFNQTIAALEQGEIVAVKGIGGFLLMADACNQETIELLRQRKIRPTKPFALLYPRLDMLEQDCFVSPTEKKAYCSIESPIVLVKKRKVLPSGICVEAIAPELDYLGAMQGYTPLLDRIARTLDRPLIATSGNMSGSPIAYTDSQALNQLGQIADLILTNNREILVPQDDSVVRFSKSHNISVLLRRSRGFAPTYIPSFTVEKDISLLATGGQLKSSFALSHRGNIYVSQYLGKLENIDNSDRMRMMVDHFRRVLDHTPSGIVSDLHPDYEATWLGDDLAARLDIPHYRIQHHQAHAWAVLGENDLLNSSDPVLCLVFDGTGLGDDGNIWGGECFKYDRYDLSRVDHLPEFKNFLGDKMAREPRLSALSLFHEIEGSNEILRKKFNDKEWTFYSQHIQRPNHRLTSSIGRLFDGVTSLLEFCDINGYEGQAAILLEQAALRFLDKGGEPESSPYPLPLTSQNTMLKAILKDIISGKNRDYIALRFHHTLAAWCLHLTRTYNCSKVAFSGGVFQNALLVDLISDYLKNEAVVYFHRNLSPNDENIAFGQLIYGLQKVRATGPAITKEAFKIS